MKIASLLCLCVAGTFAATTVELLAGDSRFSTLVSLVTQANLVDTLNMGTFTIFAPTNEAFKKVDPLTLTLLQNNVTILTYILQYHVVKGSIASSMATNDLIVSTVNGAKARFNIYTHNNKVTIQGQVISQFDMMASNGIVHVIDGVMMPPIMDIPAYVTSHQELSTLLSLVVKANLVSALQGEGLTLFAPTNAAFARLTPEQLAAASSNSTLLAEILTYHVVQGTEFSAGLYQREKLATLSGSNNLKIHFLHHGQDAKVDRALITMADIGVTNGVVHVIDHVLMPKMTTGSPIFG